MAILVNERLCPQNHRCPAVRACPVNALAQKGHDAPTVDAETCIDCARCTRVCPTGALQLDSAPSSAQSASAPASLLRRLWPR